MAHPEPDSTRLQHALDALRASAPELDDTARIVLFAVREFGADSASAKGVNTVRLAKQLDIEHALIRRAATELEANGYILSTSVGGASPALRLSPV